MPTTPRNAHSPDRPITLPNGLSVVLQPMDHVASVAVGIWIRAGGRYEPLRLAGISHFVEHLLFKGTRTRSCEQLKRAIEGIGGSLNGFTAEEFTCYMAKVPSMYLRRALGVLSDMVLHPALNARDIQKEREVILEEIRMYEDAPGQYVHELFNQLVWPHHPLGSLLSGTIQTVRRISRSDLVHYWRRLYHPRNCLISCTGAFDPERVIRQLRQAFAGASPRSIQHFAPAPRPPRGPQVRLLRKSTEQTHVCLGTPSLPRTHPNRFALELLHVILGANMSSRLFHEVREKRGLVYEIGTQIKRYQDAGAFVIYAGCDSGKLLTTLQTVIAELARVKREPIRPQELRRAKDFYRGQLLMGLEDTMERMLWLGEQAITVGRISKPEDLLVHLDRVAARQMRQVAKQLFTPQRIFLAVIGPVPEPQTASLRRVLESA